MLLYLNSFGHFAVADAAQKATQLVAGSGGLSIVAGRRPGSFAMRCLDVFGGANADWLRYVVPASGDTFIFGMAFKQEGAFNAAGNMLTCWSAGAAQFQFRQDGSGHLAFYRGNSTLVATSTLALTSGVWQYIEFKVKISPTAGTVDIKVDGAVFMTLTGQNTRGTGTTNVWDEFSEPQANAQTFNYMDVYCCDGSGADGWTDFRGDTRVDARFLTANGAHRDWTPSAGTDDYAVVDEALANGDADYLSTNVVGNLFTGGCQDAPVPGAQIYGVQVVAQIRKTDATTAGHKAVARIGGVDYFGAEAAVPASYAFLRQCWGLSPATGAAWTEAAFNAAEFGAQKSS